MLRDPIHDSLDISFTSLIVKFRPYELKSPISAQ